MYGEVIAMRKIREAQGLQFREPSADFRSGEWIDNEVVGCEFEDVRHGKRLRQLLEQLAHRVGATTPWACQDWANTKAAYRFFGNERISESNILAGHFACTRERFSASHNFPVLVLHDTTELSYRHEDTASIGILNKTPAGHKGRAGLYGTSDQRRVMSVGDRSVAEWVENQRYCECSVVVLAAAGQLRPAADTLRPLRGQMLIDPSQPLALLVDVDRRKGRAQPLVILLQAAVAHLRKSKHALQDAEGPLSAATSSTRRIELSRFGFMKRISGA